MNTSKFKKNILISTKLGMAITSIFALLIVAGSDLAQDESLITIIFSFTIFLVIFLVFFIFSIIIILSFSQKILKSGGTDTAWFWFKGEPPGLEKQRAELKEFIKNVDIN